MPNVLLLPGDGIGQEIVPEAAKAVRAVGERFQVDFRFQEALVGGAAYDDCGDPCLRKHCAFAKKAMPLFWVP